MTFDYPALVAAAFLCAVAVGYGYPLGRWLWRRTLLVDRRWSERRERRRVMRAAMRETRHE